MASRRNFNSARLDEAVGEAVVEQTKRIEAELQKEADLQKDGTFSSIKFKLSCRRV